MLPRTVALVNIIRHSSENFFAQCEATVAKNNEKRVDCQEFFFALRIFLFSLNSRRIRAERSEEQKQPQPLIHTEQSKTTFSVSGDGYYLFPPSLST